jgi:NTE family protein
MRARSIASLGIKKRAATVAPRAEADRIVTVSSQRTLHGVRSSRDMVALVMGAGGPVGHAFHAGVLRALAEGCGWDPRSADLIVGTSAGAVAGALLRAGLSGQEMFAVAHQRDRLYFPSDGARRWWPASPEYLRLAVRRPWSVRPGRLLSALLPEGLLDNQPLGDAISRLHPERWPRRPLWITAVSLEDGARVVFGRPDAPALDLSTAVRCSAAVPWLHRPVRFGGQRFVDGGMASLVHLDVLADLEPRVVVVSSPLSCFLPLRLLVRIEVERLRRRGLRVIVFEPDDEVAQAMSWNPMDVRPAAAVAAAAYRAARRHLENGAATVAMELPAR